MSDFCTVLETLALADELYYSYRVRAKGSGFEITFDWSESGLSYHRGITLDKGGSPFNPQDLNLLRDTLKGLVAERGDRKLREILRKEVISRLPSEERQLFS